MADFEEFLKPLKETHFSLGDFVDFPKVIDNVERISIKLNQLNYLIGKADMEDAVQRLWNENPNVFSVLGILIAVRSDAKKKVIDRQGKIHLIEDYFKSPKQVVDFLNSTGLTKVLQNRQIKNLVDYVFGVEVGLDTNARKNRSGDIMQNLIASILNENGITFREEVYSSDYPAIVDALGTDKKRFDFVVETNETTYLIEVNFFSGGGSKLNEVARSFRQMADKVNSVEGFEFVWITDGIGWQSAKNKLEEAYLHIPNLYNLATIKDFIDKING